jgi:undecaprenyl-diphosphatase
MSILEAVTLGVIQGLTEFLPISSTAHLRVVPALLGWDDPGAAFSAVIQVGTLAAVCVAMRRDIAAILCDSLASLRSGRLPATPASRAGLFIIFGTVPIVVAGLLFKDFIKGPLRSLEAVITALLAATVVMMAAEWLCRRRGLRGDTGRDGLDTLGWTDCLLMGCAQALALFPGTSRSGITIAAGMLGGLDRRTAARFSFLLSLPAIAAAALLELVEERHALLGSRAAVEAAVWGTLTAAIVGYAAIRWLLRMLTSHTLWPFIAYRIVLAGLLAWALASGLVPATAATGEASSLLPHAAPVAQASRLANAGCGATGRDTTVADRRPSAIV